MIRYNGWNFHLFGDGKGYIRQEGKGFEVGDLVNVKADQEKGVI